MALEDYKEEFWILDKISVPDGLGGFIEDYKRGSFFVAGIFTTVSTEMRMAEAQGVTSKYTVNTGLNVPLHFGDIIQRDRDEKYYRITNDTQDMITPNVAFNQYRVFTAENWIMPRS